MRYANDFALPSPSFPQELLGWLTSKTHFVLWDTILRELDDVINNQTLGQVFVGTDPVVLSEHFEEIISSFNGEEWPTFRQKAWHKGAALRLADYYWYVANYCVNVTLDEQSKLFYDRAHLFIAGLLEVNPGEIPAKHYHEILVVRYREFPGPKGSFGEYFPARQPISVEELLR